MSRSNENVIEWLTGQEKVSLTLGQEKHVKRVRRFAERFPDQVDIVENEDGSIFAHVPLSWIKITPPQKREYTEEEREKIAIRLAHARKQLKE